MITLEELMRRVRDLPPLPTAVMKLLTMCRDPEVSPREIVAVIELEPALTLKVLRLCNSPFYGLKRTVTTVRDAVVFVGADALANYVLAGCLSSFYAGRSNGYSQSTEESWRHAIGTAVCAQAVAEHCDKALAPLAFTCGLLHDVGKMVLATCDETERFRILPLAEQEGISFLEAERAVLGYDHAQAGAALAFHWNLPGEIVESLRWQYHPLRAPHHARLASLVNLGHVLCVNSSPSLGLDALTCSYPLDVLESLGVSVGNILEIGSTVSEKLAEAIDAFESAESGQGAGRVSSRAR